MDWMKIGTALLLLMMIIYLFPRAKEMMTHSPKAEPGEWQTAILPILAVILFVMVLIALV